MAVLALDLLGFRPEGFGSSGSAGIRFSNNPPAPGHKLAFSQKKHKREGVFFSKPHFFSSQRVNN